MSEAINLDDLQKLEFREEIESEEEELLHFKPLVEIYLNKEGKDNYNEEDIFKIFEENLLIDFLHTMMEGEENDPRPKTKHSINLDQVEKDF